jgi:hypothetical protein
MVVSDKYEFIQRIFTDVEIESGDTDKRNIDFNEAGSVRVSLLYLDAGSSQIINTATFARNLPTQSASLAAAAAAR